MWIVKAFNKHIQIQSHFQLYLMVQKLKCHYKAILLLHPRHPSFAKCPFKYFTTLSGTND